MTLLEAFLFFLPGGIANMTPVLTNKIPFLNKWNTPIDFGKSHNGQRILGDNKRWRGLVWGAVVAGISAVLLESILPSRLPFNSVNQALYGGLAMGLGALVGDATESYFKRLKGFKPGQSWFPFDQIDYIIGGLIFVYPFINLTSQTMLVILILYFGLHLLSAYTGYLLKLKDQPI